ncbi:hypothetical protein Tco_0811262 [Tanacetum coccineum]
MKAQHKHCFHFFSQNSNSTLKSHIMHPHCEALKTVPEEGKSSMYRDRVNTKDERANHKGRGGGETSVTYMIVLWLEMVLKYPRHSGVVKVVEDVRFADSIKSFTAGVQVSSADYVSAGHVLFLLTRD